jgi:hypothetical protein
VRAWWNALDADRRADISMMLQLVEPATRDWDSLLPIGHQMYLHMWFDGVLSRRKPKLWVD